MAYTKQTWTDGQSPLTAARMQNIENGLALAGQYLGSGTAFPTVGIQSGDMYFRSDVGTNGSLWQYTGNVNIGKSGWVCESPVVCTSTTRPAASALYSSLQILETDTTRLLTYSGTAWIYPGDNQPSATFTANQTSAQPANTMWGPGPLTLVSQKGGFAAPTAGDRIQVPTDSVTAGWWMISWRIVLASGTFTGPVNTMSLSLASTNSGTTANPPDAKATVGAASDNNAEGLFLLNIPAGYWVLFQSYLALSATTNTTSRIQFTRIGN